VPLAALPLHLQHAAEVELGEEPGLEVDADLALELLRALDEHAVAALVQQQEVEAVHAFGGGQRPAHEVAQRQLPLPHVRERREVVDQHQHRQRVLVALHGFEQFDLDAAAQQSERTQHHRVGAVLSEHAVALGERTGLSHFVAGVAQRCLEVGERITAVVEHQHEVARLLGARSGHRRSIIR
jgi:hypothetical protein